MNVKEFITRLHSKGIITDDISDDEDCQEYRVKKGYVIRTPHVFSYPFFVHTIIIDDDGWAKLTDYGHTVDYVLADTDDCSAFTVSRLEQIEI
jgi:hypothetical protein